MWGNGVTICSLIRLTSFTAVQDKSWNGRQCQMSKLKMGEGCCAPSVGELGPHLTQCCLGILIHPSSNRLATITNVTDRQDRQRSDSIGRTCNGSLKNDKLYWNVLINVQNTKLQLNVILKRNAYEPWNSFSRRLSIEKLYDWQLKDIALKHSVATQLSKLVRCD